MDESSTSAVPELLGDAAASGPESLECLAGPALPCGLSQDQEAFWKLGLTKEVLAAHTQDHPGLTEQWGQTKPLMFSTSPITRSPTFLQKVSSRLTSPTDTAWRPGKGQGQQIGEKGTAERLPQGEGACSGTVPEAW